MNEFKSSPQAEESDNETTNGSMHDELLRARVRQRRFYLLLTLVLFSGAILTLGLIAFSNGTLIEVQPKQAKDTAVLNVAGALGGSIGSTVYSLFGNPTIEVSAAGFSSLRKTLLDSETGGTLRIELSEVPQLLRVTTKPDSDKTRWFVDGKMVMIAKQLQQKLLSGEHKVEIDSPYFKKKNISVVMELAKPLDRSVDLQPISGEMTITTAPTGASVRINGEAVGLSPVSVTKTGGQYRLEVMLGDYQTISADVEIINTDKQIERDYRLVPKNAYVHVHLSPAGGELLLNGKKVISSTEKLAISARANNILSYHKPGYFSQHQTVSIAPGAEKKISFQLKTEMGVIDVRSKPNAVVIVDGKQMGKTPLLLTLSALPHRIELRKRGFRSYKKTIRPSSKSRQKIRAVLRTELQARLSESPREFNNSVGMRLKLFKPRGSFVMGAPRYEKGQRANEFLRTVKLTRPFYIGEYEVTGAQYARFRSKKGDSLPSSGRKGETV
ncbi:MAG: PEGA domain-containing protein, partial [Mariprofundus sp.]|nr:PEGA domain-containing protein [Mariprofundus sp.]